MLWHLGVASSETVEGAWRCDINISVKRRLSDDSDWVHGVRTELKHVQKFNVVKTAIEFEVARQIKILESGKEVVQETMGLDENGHTKRLRGKEDSPDYRYMPEPDLPALKITERLVNQIAKNMPESLDTRRNRLETKYGMSAFHIGVLMDEPGAVEFYEELAVNRDSSKTLNWLISNLFAHLNKNNLKLADCPISVQEFGDLIDLVETEKISGIRGKDVLAQMFSIALSGDGRKTPLAIAIENDWLQDEKSSDSDLELIAEDLIAKHSDLVCTVRMSELIYFQVAEIRSGRTRKLKFFAGQIMRITKGKANPVRVDAILKNKIGI
ncbi:hypothetical protein HDU83_000997 [Entophlyctis luteolus]|nr:hypothetical protein HDU83_000997 [Entophlyctis luteolus]